MAIAPLPAGRLRALSELSNLGDDTTRQHALANALMLASHPWLVHMASLARPPPELRLPPLSLGQLRSELVTAPAVASTCHGELHSLRNGTVWFGAAAANGNRTLRECGALLRRLSEPEELLGGGYGVIDLEAQQSLVAGGTGGTGGHEAEDDERCSRGLRRLANAMDHLYTLLDGVTAGQHQAAHTMLRLGFARHSAYGMHHDGPHNLLAQLAGTKTLLLAPPSQAAHAYLHARGHPEARHSPVDWRAPPGPDLRRFPAAARLRGFTASLAPGDVLYIPSGWLHAVVDNAAPASGGGGGGGGGGGERAARRRPWVSMNLFFRHAIEPRFDLFASCDAAAVAEARARMPPAHASVLEQLGVFAGQRAYCAPHERL